MACYARYYTCIDSPVGRLLLTANDRAITGLYMENDPHGPVGVPEGALHDAARFTSLQNQLDDYFAGRLFEFDIELDLVGTPFQRSVWQALRALSYGQTISYGELARRIGNPNAVRAVALANGRNPVAIVVPCHRVIGANGSLTGYSGGLENKRRLLLLEAAGIPALLA